MQIFAAAAAPPASAVSAALIRPTSQSNSFAYSSFASASRDEAALSADSGISSIETSPPPLMFIERHTMHFCIASASTPSSPAASSSGPSSAMRHDSEYLSPSPIDPRSRRNSSCPRWSTAAATSAVSRTSSAVNASWASALRVAINSSPSSTPSMSTHPDDASSAKDDGGPSERRAYSSSSAPAHS